MAGWIVVLLIAAVGVGAIYTNDISALFGGNAPDTIYGLVGLCIAVLTFAALSLRNSQGVLRSMRDLSSWLLLLSALAAGYNYRDDLVSFGHLVAAEIAQPGLLARADTQTEGERAVKIRRRPDGHFVARTELNGFAMTMLVDTGASTVVLRPADAQKLGIDVDRLRYSVPVQTANGTTYAAAIKLKRVAVGSIQFNEIDALVAKPGALRDSLLGMSFLNRLKSYEFSGDLLTLRI